MFSQSLPAAEVLSEHCEVGEALRVSWISWLLLEAGVQLPLLLLRSVQLANLFVLSGLGTPNGYSSPEAIVGGAEQT